jgi:hypothetical protein
MGKSYVGIARLVAKLRDYRYRLAVGEIAVVRIIWLVNKDFVLCVRCTVSNRSSFNSK